MSGSGASGTGDRRDGGSGSGKSSVGERLGERLGLPFRDADGFHPAANIRKMTSGTPLTDETAGLARCHRRALGAPMPAWWSACSALRRIYRDRLTATAGRPVLFVLLSGSRQTIGHRIGGRKGHFMPPSLLDSQFATLEPPCPKNSPSAFRRASAGGRRCDGAGGTARVARPRRRRGQLAGRRRRRSAAAPRRCDRLLLLEPRAARRRHDFASTASVSASTRRRSCAAPFPTSSTTPSPRSACERHLRAFSANGATYAIDGDESSRWRRPARRPDPRPKGQRERMRTLAQHAIPADRILYGLSIRRAAATTRRRDPQDGGDRDLRPTRA